MAMNTYGGPGNLNPTTARAAKELLDVIGPMLALDPFAKVMPVPPNSTDTQIFSRPVIPDSDTTPAAEGVNKPPRTMVFEQVQVQIDEYEETFSFSSKQMELGEFGDQLVQVSKDVLAEYVNQIREEVGFAAYRAGSNVYYNSNSITSRGSVNGPITLGRLDLADRFLKNNRGQFINKAASGAMQQGTVPMPPSWVAFGHTDLASDLRAIPGYREAAEVGGLKLATIHWAGSVRNIAFVLSPHFKPIIDSGAAVGSTGMRSTSGSNIDVYPIVLVSKDSIARLSFKGSGKGGYGGFKINVLDGADKSDPNNKRVYVGGRWYDKPFILRDAGVIRIEVGVTANPS